ncbi:transposase Tn3 (plasmid) [Streptomyces clavuligerus]|uniref:Transposase Tn3 n=1 Tax=Streptomyces clavuligerus TaxID=1901 RepID=D5SIU0_STRCL|nr:transposase Tn3 [Streptomyces clavuligerus]
MPAHPPGQPGLREHPDAAGVLAEPEWSGLLGPADRRGLTPLFWGHVRPYGEAKLSLASRLEIGHADLGGLGTVGGTR